MTAGRAVIADVYRFPAPVPESDGTLHWDDTTAVVVHVHSGDVTGPGWTYSSPAAAAVVRENLREVVIGRDPSDINGAWPAMHRRCRNFGTRGLVTQALSAIDVALRDLKARLRATGLGHGMSISQRAQQDRQ